MILSYQILLNYATQLSLFFNSAICILLLVSRSFPFNVKQLSAELHTVRNIRAPVDQGRFLRRPSVGDRKTTTGHHVTSTSTGPQQFFSHSLKRCPWGADLRDRWPSMLTSPAIHSLLQFLNLQSPLFDWFYALKKEKKNQINGRCSLAV